MACCIHILSIVKAHSAFIWDALAEAFRHSYVGIYQALVLKKYINWSESIDPSLNKAEKTDGVCFMDVTLLWMVLFT